MRYPILTLQAGDVGVLEALQYREDPRRLARRVISAGLCSTGAVGSSEVGQGTVHPLRWHHITFTCPLVAAGQCQLQGWHGDSLAIWGYTCDSGDEGHWQSDPFPPHFPPPDSERKVYACLLQLESQLQADPRLGAHVIVLEVEDLHVGASEPLDKGPEVSRMMCSAMQESKKKRNA